MPMDILGQSIPTIASLFGLTLHGLCDGPGPQNYPHHYQSLLPLPHTNRIGLGSPSAAAAAPMLGHLRRSSQRLPVANLAVYSIQSSHIEDDVAIIKHIQNSTKELKQGPVGKNLSSAEKRKFLVNTLLDLEDSKEGVYSTLDAWVAFEQEFPVASLKQALVALEKEEQWHRIVQVIKWMLSKGQGKTIRTYEQLVCALEKDNRADEACRIWELKIAHDLQSVPWRFCHLMLGIYYRNNRLDTLVKLFKNLEACGRKPPSKDIVRKVEDTYEMLGLVEEKKELLEKYKELFDKPSSNDRKKGRQFKKAEKNTKTG
uniref:Pentacotripeptide-repeat region of PRORP domain-containing protein n=1 Tax=Oryza barthii TaxID=65489 RepID=A0A0D3HQU1_9ORYZ